VCRQRPELSHIFVSSILNVFEVTERYVSSSLCQKIEQQSITVLPHYSADSATVAPFLYNLCSYILCLWTLLPTVHCIRSYIINTQLLNLSLGCNFTTIWAISPLFQLYNTTQSLLPIFYHNSHSNIYICTVWQPEKIYNFYHLTRVWLSHSIVLVARPTFWLHWCVVRRYLTNLSGITTVTDITEGAFLYLYLCNFNIVINISIIKRNQNHCATEQKSAADSWTLIFLALYLSHTLLYTTFWGL